MKPRWLEQEWFQWVSAVLLASAMIVGVSFIAGCTEKKSGDTMSEGRAPSEPVPSPPVLGQSGADQEKKSEGLVPPIEKKDEQTARERKQG